MSVTIRGAQLRYRPGVSPAIQCRNRYTRARITSDTPTGRCSVRASLSTKKFWHAPAVRATSPDGAPRRRRPTAWEAPSGPHGAPEGCPLVATRPTPSERRIDEVRLCEVQAPLSRTKTGTVRAWSPAARRPTPWHGVCIGRAPARWQGSRPTPDPRRRWHDRCMDPLCLPNR